MVKITNTLTGLKEEFKPLSGNTILMYVCGVTPYDRSHIGHGRCYVSFDILYRVLTFMGYDVVYCRNFTDIDDKLINKAQHEYGDGQRYAEVAQRYIDFFHHDMRALGCKSPRFEPRVTQSIDLIIDFIEKLIAKGDAYVSGGDVYFNLEKCADYPQLSKHKREDLIAGARVEVGEKKHAPLDFALWKAEAEGTYFKSPWGYGRPGWHIECSAMAEHYLAPHIDIHGGGEDLMFPHHDNEIAQSESLYGKPFARCWVHNGLVRINKEKMSKSLGNFFTLDDVFKQINPMVLRYYYLMHHYRSPLDFSFDDLQAAEKSYRRLITTFSTISTDTLEAEKLCLNPLIQSLMVPLSDDFNTAAVIGKIFEYLNQAQRSQTDMSALKWFIQQILGLSLEALPERSIEITPEIQTLLDERSRAREAKDWKRSDELRDQLQQLGVAVKDQKV
jgi:cysteinyl-tRNA synthetase